MIWCTLGLLCCAASGLETAALNGISLRQKFILQTEIFANTPQF